MPGIDVFGLDDVFAIQDRIREAARRSRLRLQELSADPLLALHTLKFEEFGYHPTEPRQLNFIEQLNQTFTMLTTLAAACHVLEWFPGSGGLRLNLGATPGSAIISLTMNLVEAEVFATVRPQNNSRLVGAISKMSKSPAAHPYVFFYSPGYVGGQLQTKDKIEIWAIGREEIM